MADIDFFKDVNDTYGHVIGDKVLKDFAALISESINNDSCWAARYGGEEFIIVLNNIDIETSYEVAEKIRKRLEEKIFVYDEIHIKITSSFGVYCVDNKKIEINDLINEVDKNLYKAKQSGRNITIK
jgi:diguanylate cyclase (GGDEF)-like protein